MSEAFSLLHPAIQQAIWRMGWSEMRPIQIACIETLLTTSKDAVVSAQTAGGKTEAAFLPVLSRIAENPQAQAIYVGPLKALINDQFQRLEKLCSDAQIPVHRWHGDVSVTEKKHFREHPGGVLLITPESLESNFINYGRLVPQLYAGLDFVVIDELHVFLNDVRGIHLRSLLSRLATATGRNPRYIGLSATLGSPQEAQAFLRPNNPDQVEIITDPNQNRKVQISIKSFLSRPRSADDKTTPKRLRPEDALKVVTGVIGEYWNDAMPLGDAGVGEVIKGTAVEDSKDAIDNIAVQIAKHFSKGTNLIFANSRSSLERLADTLHDTAKTEHWPHDPFCLHHSSINRGLREEVEGWLKSGRPTTALCTSTMELGIDLGSVKTVGQIDPPFSVAAFMQRLGRSGRREGEVAVMRMFSRDPEPSADSTVPKLLCPNLLRSIALVVLMQERWIEPRGADRMHLSTLVHQIISLLRQTGGLTAPVLFKTLCVEGPFRAVKSDLFKKVLLSLGEHEIIEHDGSPRMILTPKGEGIAAGRDFYAAFQTKDEFTIRAGTETVGQLPSDAVPQPGDTFILAGRKWEVETIKQEEKTVWVKSAGRAKDPTFISEPGELHTKLLEAMRGVLLSEENPAYLDPEGVAILSMARHVAKVTGAASVGVLKSGNESLLFPWKGTRILRTLKAYAERAGIDCDTDQISIRLSVAVEELGAWLRSVIDDASSPEELSATLPVKAFDRFDGLLNEEILDFANANDRLDIPGAKSAAKELLERLSGTPLGDEIAKAIEVERHIDETF